MNCSLISTTCCDRAPTLRGARHNNRFETTLIGKRLPLRRQKIAQPGA
jgi:hypothetical protein